MKASCLAGLGVSSLTECSQSLFTVCSYKAQFLQVVGLSLSMSTQMLQIDGSSASTDAESGPLTEEPRWRLATRIAESAYFSNSRLLSRLLLFICECSLQNRFDELTERNIGIVVFQRRPNYKTTEDNIVRSYIRQLRQRLDVYFEAHGDEEQFRIVVPRGGYCALFEQHVSAEAMSIPEDEPILQSVLAEQSEPKEARIVPLRIWMLLVAVLLGGMLGAIGFFAVTQFNEPISPAHVLWNELFTVSMPTDIVTADSALATLQELSGTHPTLQQYVDGSYFAQFEKADTDEQRRLQRLSREHLTGLPDVNTVANLLRLPEVRNTQVRVKSSRTFSMDQIKDANVILLGSADSTPWVSLFDPRMNFRGVFDQSVYSSYFENAKPLPGEQANYRNQSTAPPYATYAVIAFLPNVTNSGRVLIVEGLTTSGTEAASSFLSHGEMEAFLKTVPRDGHALRPFELLLKTTDVDSSSSSVEIVAKRIY
jgi:hypothetical protein